jgi:hypothetical protein
MKPLSFWISNISNRNVSLSDLNLTIKAFSSVNLLDRKHYSYTVEELQKSVSNGSLFKKRDKLIMRQTAPEMVKKNMLLNMDASIPNRERSLYDIKEEKYEELAVSDEEFANANAEIAALDDSIQKNTLKR